MDELYQYVIYQNPKDLGVNFAVRKWVIVPGAFRPAGLIGTSDTLEEARGMLPDDVVKLSKFEGDDPVILEVWM